MSTAGYVEEEVGARGGGVVRMGADGRVIVTPASVSPSAISAQAIELARKTERIRAVRMIHEALLEWRCVPSKHLREFADQVVAKIEQEVEMNDADFIRRTQSALDSPRHAIPPGMTSEEMRDHILAVAQQTDKQDQP